MSTRAKVLLVVLLLCTGFCFGVSAVLGKFASVEKPVVIAAPPQMPTQIDVMGVQWKVQILPDMGAVVGYTKCNEHRILITTKAWNPHSVLIHELMHTVVCRFDPTTNDWTLDNFYYNSSTIDDHEGFAKMGDVLSEILTRNPDLAAYLGSPIEYGK